MASLFYVLFIGLLYIIYALLWYRFDVFADYLSWTVLSKGRFCLWRAGAITLPYLTLPYLTLPLMEVGWNGDGERGGLRGIFRHEMSDEYRTARTDDEFCECEFA